MTRARGGKVVELTADEASAVVSDAAWVNGCPFCSALGKTMARRFSCHVYAEALGFWKRTPDQIASVIRVRPARRGRRSK